MLSEPLSYGALRYIARDASQFPDCGYVFATGRGGSALLKQRAVAAGQYFRLTDEPVIAGEPDANGDDIQFGMGAHGRWRIPQRNQFGP
jgi:hypothetical protein